MRRYLALPTFIRLSVTQALAARVRERHKAGALESNTLEQRQKTLIPTCTSCGPRPAPYTCALVVKENMFNRLEIDIFAWIKGKYPKSTLANQIASAKLISRRWSRVGFYLDFEVDKSLPKLKMEDYGGTFPISGPGIESEEIHNGGGSLLWGKDGYINSLELFAYGDYFKEEVNNYKLLNPPKKI